VMLDSMVVTLGLKLRFPNVKRVLGLTEPLVKHVMPPAQKPTPI